MRLPASPDGPFDETLQLLTKPACDVSQVPVRLPASPDGAPYVLVPYLAAPGAESPFKLSILVDDLDDDGNPDITFEPLLPNRKCRTADRRRLFSHRRVQSGRIVPPRWLVR